MHFLGIDVGSSSVKLSVLDGAKGTAAASAQYPKYELEIASPEPSWAEQAPETWWECIKSGCAILFGEKGLDPQSIEAVGITYQMHGLVLVDKDQQVLRPSIIWCDSRAVPVGRAALQALGDDYCFDHLLNSPGNFTAAKLRWVQENEPELYGKIHKAMLPGDYVAMKLSGEITTTASGLSEGIFWDFKEAKPAQRLLEHWGIDKSLLPEVVPSIGHQCRVNAAAAKELGLREGIAVSYRSGDQPNNAFTMNVLQPGEVAANAGTSGVVYAVTDQPLADRENRVNTFIHVTNTEQARRNGILMCVNGTGRSYSWLRQILSAGKDPIDYVTLNNLAEQVPVGSRGLSFIPFGNGAERILQNRNVGAHLHNIDLNRHGLGDIVRATQEGIVFALNAGFDVLKGMGSRCDVVRAPKGNMFLSDLFCEAFANTTQTKVELYDTDSAEGAARGAALGCGYFSSYKETFAGLTCHHTIEPQADLVDQYQSAYQHWLKAMPSTEQE